MRKHMFRFRRVFAVVVVTLAILSSPISPSFAQTTKGITLVAQANNALIMDAEAYASTMGVDIDEAIRRLKLQDIIGELNRELTEKEEETFAGLWIQHQPEYRVVIQFTRGGKDTIQSYIESGFSVLDNLIEVHTASVPFKKLEVARAQAAQIAKGIGLPVSSGINVFENRAEVYVIDRVQLSTALQATELQLPANVEIVEFKELPKEVANIYGGLALSQCTSGFSVRNSGGIKGITTAGHCDNDTISYNQVNLPFISGTAWPSATPQYDIQWHRGDHAFTVRNLMWDGTHNRYVFSVKFRSSQSVGEWVCKYGKTTHFACGTIATTSQDGVNVRVDNLTVQGGDSSGPWFSSNTAYGTTISSCTLSNGNPCAIYGPVDQIYNILGLTILTN